MKTMLLSTAIASMMAATAHAEVTGYLFTTLNGETTNQVISLARNEDGSLGEQVAYSTGSLGGADRAAGGDAAGDFDSQGAVQIIGNHLLAVNAGGNTISVFGLDRTDGSLDHVANVASGGTRPVSIAFTPKSAGSSQYWVVVGNQWNNPNVQKGGDGESAIEFYPDMAFHAEGGGHEAVLDDRNITLFSFDSETGELTQERVLDTYSGTNGGPTTVSFNRDGSKLAVATWGIAHFGTATPTEQKPSRVYVYDFDGASGAVEGERFYEEDGVAGSIGFSWDKNTDRLFVSNFNLVTDKRDHSLTVLADDGNEVAKVGHFGTGEGADIDEACWTITSADGSKLYVSSFGGNLISVFDVDPSGNVSRIGDGTETAYALRQDGTPPGDTKDMFISADGQHMYVLGAYQTFTVSEYSIDANGLISLEQETHVDAATESGPGTYNFLGLAGFDI
jgi:6-phosphogluconolactonase (cycloisomerase 2 family)